MDERPLSLYEFHYTPIPRRKEQKRPRPTSLQICADARRTIDEPARRVKLLWPLLSKVRVLERYIEGRDALSRLNGLKSHPTKDDTENFPRWSFAFNPIRTKEIEGLVRDTLPTSQTVGASDSGLLADRNIEQTQWILSAKAAKELVSAFRDYGTFIERRDPSDLQNFLKHVYIDSKQSVLACVQGYLDGAADVLGAPRTFEPPRRQQRHKWAQPIQALRRCVSQEDFTRDTRSLLIVSTLVGDNGAYGALKANDRKVFCAFAETTFETCSERLRESYEEFLINAQSPHRQPASPELL